MLVGFFRWSAKIFWIALKASLTWTIRSMEFSSGGERCHVSKETAHLTFLLHLGTLLIWLLTTDSSCPGCYTVVHEQTLTLTPIAFCCAFLMSAFSIRLWYPWEQGPHFFTLRIFCIWNTTWNMIDITESSLIQFIFCNHHVAKHSPFNLVLVEYMLSRHHICGFSVSGVSETFQGSCKMFKDENYYSYFYVIPHSG